MIGSCRYARTEALALAYIELQKAHNRDYAASGGVDYTQNSIVLFTDGVPDSMAVSPNSAANNVINPSSTCQVKVATSTANQMMGTIATPGNPGSWGAPFGMFLLTAYDTTQSLTYWLQNAGDGQLGTGDLIPASPTAAFANCSGLAAAGTATPAQVSLTPDLTQIPPYDIYGTSTSGTAYVLATLDQANGTSTQPYSGMTYDPAALSNGTTGAIASWNATDNIGNLVRSQTAMQPVAVYTIGYSGDGGTDATLLKRLANTQDSTSYNPSQSTGYFIQVNSADQLGAAFTTIASQLLRLSK